MTRPPVVLLACGGYRSGSTLAYNLLGEHAERSLVGRRIGYVEPDQVELLAGPAWSFVAALGVAVGKAHHSPAIPEGGSWEALLDGRLLAVCTVRDWRDVLHSFSRVYGRSPAEVLASRRWQINVANLRWWVGAGAGARLVRYEDLHADPARVLAAVDADLGLPHDPGCAARAVAAATSPAGESEEGASRRTAATPARCCTTGTSAPPAAGAGGRGRPTCAARRRSPSRRCSRSSATRSAADNPVARRPAARHPGPVSARVECLDPVREPQDQLLPLLDELHAALVETWTGDQPHEPPPTPRQYRSQVLTPWWGDPVRLLVARDRDERPVGHALVELPARDNRHLASVEPHVAVRHRRGGAGRALLAAAADVARADGRRSLVLEARVGSPAERMAAAAGGRRVLTEVRRVQPLAALDLDRVAGLRRTAERAATGYRLESWTGPTPAARVADLARVTQTLGDAPMGQLDLEAQSWDAERVAVRDRGVAAAGLRMHTVLALAPDGAPAGYTEVAVSEDGAFAWQWGTGVVAAHRGHRLGLLVKTAMVQRLRAEEPGVQVVSTWNADANTHMIAVNEALGYRVVDEMGEWQFDLGADVPQ